ncbi:MAG TPA: hypothetical protein VIT67_03565 [Povalibacter sp.]|jgi:hypothetical protein
MKAGLCGLRKALLSIALVPLATLGVTQQASAVSISLHATTCNPYGSTSASQLYYTESGVWNYVPTQARGVICSVPRVPASSGGGSVVVDGSNNSGQRTTCVAMSFSSTGTFMAAKSFSSTAGAYTRILSFTSLEMPTSAYVSVICTLPANGGGILRGLRSF